MRRAAAFITITVQRAENRVRTQRISPPRASRQPDQLSGLAQGLSSAARTIGQVAARETAEQDASRIKKANSDYESERNKFFYGSTDDQGNAIPGLMHTVGEQAVNPEDGIPLDKKFEDWQIKYKENVLPQFGNDRQREMFSAGIDASYPSAQAAVSKHEFRQGQVVKIGNANAATETATETAIALGSNSAADPVLYQQSLDKVTEAVQVQAMLNGFGPESEYAQELLSEKMSKLHSNIIVAKVSSDDDKGAIAYYDEHSAAITDPREKRIIGEKITKIKTRVEGKDIAAGVWEEHRPEDVNEMVNLDAMREEIRTGKGSDEVKDIAVKRAEELTQHYLQQTRAKQGEVSNQIYGMATDGKTYDQVIKSIDLNSDIDNVAKDNLRNWADSKYQISTKRAERKNQQSLDQLANMMDFQTEYLRGDYGTLTPQQIATKAGDLGQFTDNAMNFVKNVNDNLGTAKATDAEMKDLIYTLSQNEQYEDLLPNLSKPTDEDKAKFVLLQQAVIDIKARSKDAPGAGKSTQAALLEAITKVRTDNGWIYDTYDPAYLIGTQNASAFARGDDPTKWTQEAQENFIRTKWGQKPSNNGKTLDAATLEAYRQTLLKAGE